MAYLHGLLHLNQPWLKTTGKKLLNFLIPPRCFCQDIVEDDGLLCGACWQKLSFIKHNCYTCGAVIDVDSVDTCLACSKSKKSLYGRSAVVYEGLGRDLVLRFKHGNQYHLGFIMAQFMLRCDLKEVDVIVPVPVPFWRLLRRTYNQSLILARHIGKGLDKPILDNVLLKKRYTPVQGHLSREERVKNVKDSFAVKKNDKIKGKNILLIDDVLTTGVTLQECAKTLKKAGAKDVSFLTFARVAYH